MAKKKKKLSFRGKVKKDNKNQAKGGSKYDCIVYPEGVNKYKPEAGNTDEFDIIPYVVSCKDHPSKSDIETDDGKETIAHKGDYWMNRPYKVHKDVGADNLTIVCPTSFNKACPICEYKKQQADDGVEWEKLKPLNAKDRMLYVIMPVDIDKAKKGYHILDMSWYLFQELLNQETNEKEEYEDYAALEDGYTLKVRWVPGALSKKGNEYAEAGRIDFEKRKKDYKESIITKAPDLDECLIEKSYDEVKALFFEMDQEDSDTDEKETKKKKNKKKSNKDVSKGAKKELSKKELSKKEKKKDKKKKVDKQETKLLWKDLEDMDLDELEEVCPVTIDQNAYKGKLDKLRLVVAKELDILVPKKAPKAKKEKKSNKKDSKYTCPEGMRFGIDTDTKQKLCDKCDIWNDCDDEKEGN